MTLRNPTYILATEGINSSSTFSIATRGYTFDVFVTPIVPPIPVPPRAGGSAGVDLGKPEEEYKNLVKVIVTIAGVKYEEEVMTTLATVNASNVHIDVVGDEEKPKISVQVY